MTEAVDSLKPNRTYDDEAAKDAILAICKGLPCRRQAYRFVQDEETLEVTTEHPRTQEIDLEDAVKLLNTDYKAALANRIPQHYGVWVPGIPVLIGNGLDAINCCRLAQRSYS